MYLITEISPEMSRSTIEFELHCIDLDGNPCEKGLALIYSQFCVTKLTGDTVAATRQLVPRESFFIHRKKT